MVQKSGILFSAGQQLRCQQNTIYALAFHDLIMLSSLSRLPAHSLARYYAYTTSHGGPVFLRCVTYQASNWCGEQTIHVGVVDNPKHVLVNSKIASFNLEAYAPST